MLIVSVIYYLNSRFLILIFHFFWYWRHDDSERSSITPAVSVTCIGETAFDMPSFNMLCKGWRPFNSETGTFSRRNKWQINDIYWPQVSDDDCTFCMLLDLRNNSNDFSIVDQLSIVTSIRISSLQLLLFARRKRSNHSVNLSQNDFLILLALFWCQMSPSLKVAFVSKWKSQLCLHFDVGQCE